jgi:aspartate/methionine/tyrosine aminotransferase
VRRFPSSPITSLIDETPRYNLAESTCRDLSLDELLGRDGAAALAKLPLGYGTSAGDPQLRRLVAASAGVAEDQVLVTTGAAAALFLLGLLFGDPSGQVVVVRPCFPPTLDALRGLGARVVTVRLRFEDGYRLDVASLAGALSPNTRLVMVASPQNPSGVVVTPDEIDQVLTAMSGTCPDALLLVDETFRAAVYGAALTPESFAGRSPRVLTCGSLSKSHGAPGLRIGWLTVPDPELYDQLRLARFNTAISCGAMDEFLAIELLRRADAILAPRRAFLADAIAVVERWVDEHRDRIRWTRPDAGAFCCVRLDPGWYGQDGLAAFHSRLAERRTLVASGDWFGDSEFVFRLGFGYEPMEKLHAGLGAISEALGRPRRDVVADRTASA